ncbi:NACHT, LRR and PYD domains-containing protein 3-like [Latimeria chalumnae]|uniref:NACHT, LRR and PYD domains-containing protein 3-like n=1 Tax=Latimeria chalumnae TaxID=7897 RepID=UPI0003C1208B|nr:PREDICTED: NACHT, LRR and PYD domains-containing protein 3-like [Latimeria chalumnae]|eukprot:XP_005990825.1 PREDICTED: NACHT, LRR and PYD domains-containing protein 3-like [Latimeria chalumnae]
MDQTKTSPLETPLSPTVKPQSSIESFRKALQDLTDKELKIITDYYLPDLVYIVEHNIQCILRSFIAGQILTHKEAQTYYKMQESCSDNTVVKKLLQDMREKSREAVTLLWETLYTERQWYPLRSLKGILKQVETNARITVRDHFIATNGLNLDVEEKKYQTIYKESLLKEVKSIKTYPLSGQRKQEEVSFMDLYTELIVADRQLESIWSKDRNEVLSEEQLNAELLKGRVRKTNKRIQDHQLFRRSHESNKFPLTIVISGLPGIGKSTLVQRILYDWVTGTHHQRFAFIFPFKFRDLNSWKEPTSLAELIQKHHPCLELDSLRKILRKPENLLFIFDGLDESRNNIDFNIKPLRVCNDPEHFTAISTIVTSLMQQTLLKGCTVVITSCPIALQTVDIKAVEHCTEIIGFSAEQRKIYFKQFFSDEKVSMEAFEYVQQNDILYTMCFNPSYCWILCSVLKPYFTKEKIDKQCPKTITQLFADFICNILINHRHETGNPRDLLTNISKMALYGVYNKCLVFDDSDMNAFELQPSQFLSGFMKEILQKEESFNRSVYTFLHLTVQEFLAALSPFLDTTTDVTELLNKANSCKDGRFEILLHFLSGLCHTVTHDKLTKILGPLSEESIRKVMDWLKTNTERELQQVSERNLLNTLHCLYETQNTTLIRSTVGNQKSLSLAKLNLNAMDCCVLSYILNCYEEFVSLYLSDSLLRQEECLKLTPGLNKCKHIRLWDCDLTAGSWRNLSSVLSTNSSLKELSLIKNNPGDSGVNLLSAGLRDPNCKIEALLLVECGLTAACCGDLSSVLSTNSSLTELYLSGNNLGDSGVKQLSAGLKDPNCKLHLLQLSGCDLPAGCCGDLSSVLSTNSSLTRLLLDRNKLGDSGVKCLSAGLKDPNCKLQELRLGACDLTAGCCEDLSSVLSTNSSLTKLSLSGNKLGDSGVKLLSVGLRDPNCKLQKLEFGVCGLTAACCEDLSSVLSTSSSLTDLDLNDNRLADSGLKLLAAGLKDPNCKLQMLWVVHNNGLSPEMKAELEELVNSKPGLEIW